MGVAGPRYPGSDACAWSLHRCLAATIRSPSRCPDPDPWYEGDSGVARTGVEPACSRPSKGGRLPGWPYARGPDRRLWHRMVSLRQPRPALRHLIHLVDTSQGALPQPLRPVSPERRARQIARCRPSGLTPHRMPRHGGSDPRMSHCTANHCVPRDWPGIRLAGSSIDAMAEGALPCTALVRLPDASRPLSVINRR